MTVLRSSCAGGLAPVLSFVDVRLQAPVLARIVSTAQIRVVDRLHTVEIEAIDLGVHHGNPSIGAAP